MNIVLAGMPGCGKTTVAKVFERRGAHTVDTDGIIVKNHGNISEIFASYGEPYFRLLETQAVKEAAAQGGVIATGGGCLLKPENVRILKENGKIIYLRTSVETLLKRVGGNSDRPLLQGDKREKLIKLYSERIPVYEGAADFTVDTDGLSPEQIADIITENIK